MGSLLSSLLSSLDRCEKEVDKILHFKGRVKIRTPHGQNNCSCGRKKNDTCDREQEYECECECKCEKL